MITNEGKQTLDISRKEVVTSITDWPQVDRTKWANYVEHHPKGNIFQTPDLFEVFQRTKNYSPVVSIYKEGDDIRGVLTAVIQREYDGILGRLSSRCLVLGGPITDQDNPEIAQRLLQGHNKAVKNKAILTQFRNIHPVKAFQQAFEKEGYEYIPHLDIHVDLTQDAKKYWNDLKGKVRQKVRKAKKNGFVFANGERHQLDESYAILKEVYDNVKLPIPDKSLFLNAYELLSSKGMVGFFIAEKKGEIGGVRWVLTYKDMIYDWYAGSLRKFYKDNPNYFLVHKVLEWGMKDPKYQIFDFGGAGKPGVPYGVRNFKLQFCENLLELGRYENVHQKTLFAVAKKGFEVWQKLKFKS